MPAARPRPPAITICLVLAATLGVAGCGATDGLQVDEASGDCGDVEPVPTSTPTSNDPFEAAVEYLRQGPPAVEGTDPDYSPWFGGVYATPPDRSVVVVAVTDLCLVDRSELEAVVSPAPLRLIEVSYGFDEITAFRDELVSRLAAAGVPASTPIDSTDEGRIINVVTPSPEDVPSDVFDGLPNDVIVLREGPVDTPA